MMGRKTKLTPELQEEVCRILRAGNYIEDACAYVGIAESTYYLWMQRGERGWKIDHDAGYVEFSEAVKKARAEAAISSVARIRQAGQQGQWQADAWFLERSYPARWGRRVQQMEHTGKEGAPISVKVNDDPDRVAAILGVLADIGVIPAGIETADDAEDDEVHPAPADG